MELIAVGGCCKSAERNYRAICQAVKELELSIEVEYVTDLIEIMQLHVIATPALLIDKKVITAGEELSVAKAKKLILKYLKCKGEK